MKLPLLYRFRGLYLGVATGEVYLQKQRSTTGQRAKTIPSHGDAPDAPDAPNELNWQQVCQEITQRLIESPWALPLTEHSPSGDLPEQNQSLLAAVLPMALFFHDDLVILDRQIQQLLQPTADLELEAGGLVLGRAIALICQEQVIPATLMPQLLAQIDIPHSAIKTGLEQVHRLLRGKATLMEALHTFAPSPVPFDQIRQPLSLSAQICLAFYCWMSTAAAFNLSLQRSGQYPLSDLSTRLTAALSGADNGFAGIPGHWHSAWIAGADVPGQHWQMPDALWATWSGCIGANLDPEMNSRLLQSAVAAPGLLRPRPQQGPFAGI